MAGTLTFPVADVQTLIGHAKAAPEQRLSFSDLFDKSLLKPGVKIARGEWAREEDIDKTKVPPSLLFVKDQGAYLMSAGVPALRVECSESSVVTYARGMHPQKDSDWWDMASAICGGDDFAERLPVAMFESALAARPAAKTIRIRLSNTKIAVSAA